MSEEGAVQETLEPPVAEEQTQEPQVESEEVSQEEEKPQEPPIPKGVQKRIDRAVRQKYEAEARAKMLEERLSALEQQSVKPPPPKPIDNSGPKIDNFDNFDEYVAAKAEWVAERKIEQTLSEREKRQEAVREEAARRETADSWHKRIVQATAEMPDFEDVIASSDVPMTEPMHQVIMESDVGPRMAYWLAQNPDEASKIAGMSPLRAVTALGRIEERLSNQQATPATIKPTSAPPPVSTVGSRASVSKDPDKMSTDEWLAWRNKQIKAKSA